MSNSPKARNLAELSQWMFLGAIQTPLECEFLCHNADFVTHATLSNKVPVQNSVCQYYNGIQSRTLKKNII